MTADFVRQTQDIARIAADFGPGAAVRHPSVLRTVGFLFAVMAAVALLLPRWAEGLAAAGAVVLACGLVARFAPGKAARPESKRPADGIFYLGTSISSGRQIWLTADECKENLIISGPSRERTDACLRIAYDAIATGSGLIYCDGKGDVSLYVRMYELARRLGREDDLLVLNFMTYDDGDTGEDGRLLSNTLNPFASGSADALTQMVVSLMDDVGYDGAMWKGRAVALFTGVMRALVWQRDKGLIDLNVGLIRDYLNLAKIIDLADQQSWPEMPSVVRGSVEAYLTSLPGFQREKGPKQSQTTLDQHGFLQMQFTQILGLLADVYGHIFLAPKAQVDMRDAALNRRILVVMLPALEMAGPGYDNLGKIVVATLKMMIGSTLGAGIEVDFDEALRGLRSDPTPFTVIFDDFEHYTVSGMGAMAGLGRAANINFVFGCNSVDALFPLTSREAKVVFASSGWRLEILPDDDESAVLKHKGTMERVRPGRPPSSSSALTIRVNHTI